MFRRILWWLIGYREAGACDNCGGIRYDDGAPCEACNDGS